MRNLNIDPLTLLNIHAAFSPPPIQSKEIALPVPGYASKDISVEITGKTLVIEGKSEKFGDFRNRYQLSKAVDADKITAKCEHGFLTVSLPPKECETKKRVVEIS